MHQQLCVGLVLPKCCLCVVQSPLIEENRAESVSQEGGSAEKQIQKSLGSSSFLCRCTFKQRQKERPSRGWRHRKSNFHHLMQRVERKAVTSKFPVSISGNRKLPSLVLWTEKVFRHLARDRFHLDFPVQFEVAFLSPAHLPTPTEALIPVSPSMQRIP